MLKMYRLTTESLPGYPPCRRPLEAGSGGATSGSGGLGAGPHEKSAPVLTFAGLPPPF